MAEYVEVMNQKRRMCNSYAFCSMGCPLNNIDFCNKNSGEKTNADFSEVERRTMAWAAEHPEPVYPTWGEWLISVGAARKVPTGIPFELHDGRIVDSPLETVVDVNTRIPADIAEKLGIEPKEDRT